MSLYINNENQKLLWNVIHNNVTAQQFFSRITENQKSEWFKSIIRLFYEKNAQRQFTVLDLQQINKATIAYMIQSIKPIQHQEQPLYSQPQQQTSFQSQNTIQPSLSKEEVFNKQFNNKKKEYEQMFEKKMPDNIDFSEKIEDVAISNMSDLIQTHIRERESELHKYSQIQKQTILPQTNNLHETLKIDKTLLLNDEILNAQVLDTSEKKQKKSVSWKEDSDESISMMFEEFQTFKTMTNEKLKDLQIQIQELHAASKNLQI